MIKILSATLSVIMLIPVVSSSAATTTYKHPTISMKSGNRAGLQNVFAWDEKCRTVPVDIKAYRPKLGLVYLYKDRFKIPGNQSRECSGRVVDGYKIVFKADKNAKGTTLVEYQIRSKNVDRLFKFRRTLRIK